MDPLAEYRALVAKVDTAREALERRSGDALTCRRGCSECCEVELTLSVVEGDAVAATVRGLPAEQRAALAAKPAMSRCVMLDEEGACVIYAARPLVCRTQGLALRYPPGLVPAGALRARIATGDVTACHLNFRDRPPQADETLDAERVDAILAVVNQRHAAATERNPLERTRLRDLVR